ncbi:hypothetical protein BCR33DRAFT_824433 [Rhizoclosmatium globosum]|uniref:F-box domain-containing protein n=1 Tax=Rhizoclosmatium globosum TaxID=329046 RepID=A0A1Y2D0H9_9FUNG|nr:hypothetical protein BCR33DRAFT_824433 [Rhizoclosmatium globosum]|eukprot:ORY52626.1 hypothetical protein BCR33DRAFT_824433 [Rhizoclosmatium globosum]
MSISTRSYNQSTLINLPREILDEIICLLDSQSIIPFAHALPQFKHISKAIYDIGIAFDTTIAWIWPVFWFPVAYEEDQDPDNDTVVDYLVNTAAEKSLVSEFMGLINRYGGVVKFMIHSVDFARRFCNLQPHAKRLHLYILGAEYNYDRYYGIDDFQDVLSYIRNANIAVRLCDIPRDLKDVAVYSQILRNNPSIRVYRSHTIGKFPFHTLPECLNVQELQFDVCSSGAFAHTFSMIQLFIVLPACNLRRVTFETSGENYYPQTSLEAEEEEWCYSHVKQFGWNVKRIHAGPIFGRPCLEWRKK